MQSSLKRKTDELADTVKKIKLAECPHKESCYRRNPHHFKEFTHPHLTSLIAMGDSLKIPDSMPQSKETYLEQIAILKSLNPIVINDSSSSSDSEDIKIISEQEFQGSSRNAPGCSKSLNQISMDSELSTKCETNSMLCKLQKNYPYNLFFTTIPNSPDTFKELNSVSFPDLLCPSLGILKCSLQINFMIDIDWLLKQYKTKNLHQKPLTILYGHDWPDMATFIQKLCPNVRSHLVKMKDPFGTHHSKIGIYVYEDNSLRVVVSTANLYYEDWNNYNQGLWISPKCRKLPENSTVLDGESPTGFKKDLLSYLQSYCLGILKEWIEYVKNADFSEIRVAFVYSSPGKYYPKNNGNHLHRVGHLLSQHCNLPEKTDANSEGPLAWGIIAQSSSLGSMGKTAADWLRGNLLRSLASHSKSPLPTNSQATLSLVYPSAKNVANGYFGLESGGCLPYSKATHEKQRWLQDYMHQWIADRRNRTRAMPHIKTYCRVSPDLTRLAYFLITSANCSKSAWGGNLQKDGGSYIRSYECGVMFLPKFFDEEYFEIENTLNQKNKQLFPFIYDLPLIPFEKDDYPWCN